MFEESEIIENIENIGNIDDFVDDEITVDENLYIHQAKIIINISRIC